MKIKPAVIAAVLSAAGLAGMMLARAQQTATPVQSAQADSIVQITAEAQGLQLVSPDQVPRCGTFWWVMPGLGGGAAVPAPCPPLDQNAPIYAVTGNQFLVDDTLGRQPILSTAMSRRLGTSYTMETALEAQASMVVNLIALIQTTVASQQMRAMGMDVPSPGGAGGGSGGSGDYSGSYVPYMFNTNGLWLEITNVSNGLSYLNLHHATNQVYAIWSTTNLLTPFQVETELWPTPDQTNVLSFTVENLDRQNLFMRAEDWTGVTENGNTTPDWWFWWYFGTTALSDTNLDSVGNTLLYDYTNGIVPDYYDGELPNLQLISGDGQSGPLGAFLPQPLVVQITDWYGNPLTNAPVTFSVTSGLNQLAAFEGETLVSNLFVRSDIYGNATVWLFLPTNAPVVNTVTVTAQSGTDTEQITFTDYEGNVADPDISPAGGTFTMMPNVVMSCATTGALIHYTIDGDDPTEDDPALTNGQSMIVPWTTTVNAAAFDDAILRPSDVQSAAFTIIHPLVAGRKHTMILNPDETILAAGSNGSGQLGDGTTTDRTNLVGVLNLTNAVGVAAGALHSLAWAADGTAWAWGDDTYGQLGDGNSSGQQSSPVQIANLSGIVQMAGGYQHSLALDSSSDVWVWGNNSSGQLGDGTTTHQTTPEQLSGLNNVVGIAAGGAHSLALVSDETVRAWGNNSYGQIGDGTTTQRTTPVTVSGLTNAFEIAAGYNHSLAVVSDETVRAWGYNNYGQIGDGTTNNHATPVRVTGLSNVLAIAAGWAHSAALKSDGTVVVWGSIPYGLNGDSSGSFSTVPVTEEPSMLVNWSPPTIITQPFSQEVYQGDTVTFNVVAAGTNLTYQWTYYGSPIPGATNSSYTINNVQYGGNYAVTVGVGLNSVVSSNAVLTVYEGTGDALLMVIQGQRLDYTFKSGITYYIGSPVQLSGATTIEGGAILKFDNDYSTNSSLMVMGGLICKGEPYNPAILTSIDDDAVGEMIYFSDGYPQTAANATPYLDLTCAQSNSISNLRVCFADWGVTTPAVSRKLDVWDCQFVECNCGLVNLVAGTGADDSLHNVLFAACGAAVSASTNAITIEGEQVTADVGNFCLASSMPGRIALTNSIVWGNSPTASSLSTVNVALNPDNTNFVSEGYGSYYLAAASPLHHSGTAGISSRLQTELQHKTTCSPVSIAAFTQINGSLTLAPQASRYTNGAPDLGYYYDALDYSVANLTLSGGNLTVLPGTAIAVRNDYFPNGCWQGDYEDGYPTYFSVEGIVLQQGASLVSHGTPTKPNIFTAEKMVQEFPETDFSEDQYYWNGLWFGAITFVTDFELGDNTAPSLDFRFSKFYLPPNDYHVWSGFDEYGEIEMSPDSSMYLSLQDCHFHGGRINLGSPDYYYYDPSQVYAPGAAAWTNNSFENVSIDLAPTYYWYDQIVNSDMQLLAYNNLFRGGLWLYLEPSPTSAGNWTFEDNLFDKIDFLQDTNQPLDFDYNGYWPMQASELLWGGDSGQLLPATGGNLVGAHEPVLTTAPPYQSGPFGKFYLPNTTPLYGAGSRSAGDAGLYHYTTRIDQVKEGDESSGHKVNIGLHYIAANNYGLPKDTDGDGIPDYVENWHGDGNYSAHTDTETDWQNPMTDGVTPDAYSPVYDDVDLDGDGLTGRAERFFGTNPLIPDNPLNLSTIPQGASLSGIVQIPLNISTNMDTNTVFHFFVDGLDVGTTISQGSNSWSVEWDTMTIPNGTHFISAGTTLDLTGHKAFGVSTVIAVNNAITVDETARWFTDQLTIDANVNVDASEYTIEVYDAETQEHLQTLTGDVSNGQIQTSWNLQDDEGNRIVDGPLICDFYLTSSGSSAQSRSFRASPNDNSSGSSSASVLFKFIPHVSGQSFTVAYGYDYSSSSKMNALQTMMLSSVVENLDTLYDGYADSGGGNDYNLLPTDSGGNVPYASAWQFQDNQSSINTLEGALGSGANFYWWGHCNTDVIAPTPSGVNFVSSGMVGQILRNNADQGKIAHSYRLVILDGCEGYSKAWADAFGIVYQANGSSYTVDDYNNRFHLDPQAFVGWTVDTPAPSGWALSVDGIQEWQNALDVLFSEWQLGYPLNVCIKDYTDTLVSYGFTSDNGFLGFYGSGVAVKQYKISGCVDLTTFDR